MARLRRVETLNNILIWEPLVSLGAIVGGWLWGFWMWFSGDRKYKNLLAKHEEALSKHDQTQAMLKRILASVDAPPEEQRRIVREARNMLLKPEFSPGTVEGAAITGADPILERDNQS